MDEILQEFLVESHEHLDRMENDLVSLENNPADEAALLRIFRAVHTIKGTCGFFSLSRLESLTHAAESLLGHLCDGRVRFDPPIASTLLDVVDDVRRILRSIEQDGAEAEGDDSKLIARLQRLGEGGDTTEEAESPAAGVQSEDSRSEVASKTVRLGVDLLDSLMNMVGELVLTRNEVLEHVEPRRNPGLGSAAQRLNRITADLQASVMKARMEPVRRLWRKFPRVVRDIAAEAGKRVRIEMRGEKTELDRSVLEAAADPLTHLIRNAIDHGIEASAARAKAGKPKEGLLKLSAYQEGGLVVIEVRDDGAGMDLDAIRARALENRIVTAEELAQLSDHDVVQMVFLPGLSTAREVTSLSGRGVGMDVVRNNVERLGGSVEIRTQPGEGTAVLVKLPLTLAIISGVLVESRGHRFVLPQGSLRELVSFKEETGEKRVESVHDALVFRLRGKLLPLVHLAHELDLCDTSPKTDLEQLEEFSIAVIENDQHRYGLVVDRVLDTQEVVVKPLGPPLNRVPVFGGATILGDGSIALILDVARIATRAGFKQAAAEQRARAAPEPEPESVERPVSLLLFEGDGDERVVLPLSQVARLEEFHVEEIERVGEGEAVRYRGSILPLVHLDALLPERRGTKRSDSRMSVQVAVHETDKGAVGLVVDRIVDIVEVVPRIHEAGHREGVLGTVLVGGRVAQYLDTERVLELGRIGRDAS